MTDENKIVKFPINSSKDNMQNKKCDYKTLSIITVYSNRTLEQEDESVEELYRYLYRNKLLSKSAEIEELSDLKINTVLKNVKKLSKINNRMVNPVKTEGGEIIYYINYTDKKGREYVTIPEKQLRFLIHIGNSNVIKTYILLKYMCQNGEKKISRKYIAEQIGLSSKSKSNLQTITDILISLENNSFIKRRYEFDDENSKKNTHIYYSVNSYEYRLENYKKNK